MTTFALTVSYEIQDDLEYLEYLKQAFQKLDIIHTPFTPDPSDPQEMITDITDPGDKLDLFTKLVTAMTWATNQVSISTIGYCDLVESLAGPDDYFSDFYSPHLDDYFKYDDICDTHMDTLIG